MEIANGQAPHGQATHELEGGGALREARDELIATARMKFDMLAAIGVLTQGQARSIVHLLVCGGETLSTPDRAFRENIIRYLKKEADFVSVFAEMLRIDAEPAPRAPVAETPRITPKPSNRGPSVAPTAPKRRWAKISIKISILSLPPVKSYILPAVVASATVLLAGYLLFTPGDKSVSTGSAKSATSGAEAGSVPPLPVTAVFPSAITPEHAGEGPYEASLNTCYDQFKANREINANGGLSWNQNGGGYYGECLKRLQP